MIVVAGEALIDLAPSGAQRRASPGGSPFNVAIGLARLGCATAFLGAVSRDRYGQQLTGQLRQNRVNLGLVSATDAPTTLAVVALDAAGSATYRFELQGTSAVLLDESDLPPLPAGAPLHVAFGAVTAETTPGGVTVASLLVHERGQRFRSLDPNVRPAVIGDRRAYAEQLTALAVDTEMVKTSEEDLAWLYPTRDPLDVARDWVEAGTKLMVVTHGPRGATALRRGTDPVAVPGMDVKVVDTVGAGDAFMAGLLSWLDTHDLYSASALITMHDDALRDALGFAGRVAAHTCTRAGADPPWRFELAPASPST